MCLQNAGQQMIFDDEKAAAARRAINREISDRNIKEQRILRHLWAVSGVEQYGLPYRVLFRFIPEPFEVELNPYYPEPAEPISGQGGEPVQLQGREWERHFTRFVVPYKQELERWEPFDWFGDTKHTAEDARRQRERFTALIAEFIAFPERFDIEAPRKRLEDYRQYRVIPGYMRGLFPEGSKQAQEVEKLEQMIQDRSRGQRRANYEN